MNLLLILGDQLDPESAILREANRDSDALLMIEASEESTHVWSHKNRSALFLSAMRHFRDDRINEGFRVIYRQLSDPENGGGLSSELARALREEDPQELRVLEFGDHRVQSSIEATCEDHGVPLTVVVDDHFFCTQQDFREHARGRKQLRLEYFYRELRKRFDVLMDGDEPVGGSWNYDEKNRDSFGKEGPPEIKSPLSFPPDAVTQKVLQEVEAQFPEHPGSLENFDWPVTRPDALRLLRDFIQQRLSHFGRHQDAMWTDQPFLYHSLLSAALNLKLLRPREVVEAAEAAYRNGDVPLPSAEGFIRQILGWREYVRGIYWEFMPEYGKRNALEAKEPLPDFYWTGDTEMVCLAESIGQTLKYGYAHHIQRLMVTGLFSLLLGVEPKQIHEWYLAVYVDAVEWVELPNVIGMSQFADGGLMASKPYVATGKYIQRMSNYCSSCPYDPAKSVGEDACPFTTLYWDFLDRHRKRLEKNTRMGLQLRNLDRKSDGERGQIEKQAASIRLRCRRN